MTRPEVKQVTNLQEFISLTVPHAAVVENKKTAGKGSRPLQLGKCTPLTPSPTPPSRRGGVDAGGVSKVEGAAIAAQQTGPFSCPHLR